MLQRNIRTFTIKDPSNARDIALFVLLGITENSRKSHSILKETFDGLRSSGNCLSGTDRAFIERIVIGTLDRLITLDTVLDRFISSGIKKQKPVIRGILRSALYQIMYMDRVPDSAACNEAVRLAKLHGMDGLSGFVNGVLRNAARDKNSGGSRITGFQSDSQRYSLPEWICSLITKEYGKDKAEEIFRAFLCERRMTLRFNISRTGRTFRDRNEAERYIRETIESEGFVLRRIDVMDILKNAACFRMEEGVLSACKGEAVLPEWMDDTLLPVMYEVMEGGDITGSEAFRNGLVTVQDPSSALAASYAAPGERDLVIDVCSAPGGKALAAADLMKDSGHIEARDVSTGKVRLIEENVKRCGFGNISCRVMDALKEDEESFYRADILIADLPCSGLGVIAKKPDIKYNLRRYSIEELMLLQRDILSNVSRYVKPKGRLIYSTCTISREENEDNVAWMEAELGLKYLGGCKLLPGEDHDGFFIAVMRKNY